MSEKKSKLKTLLKNKEMVLGTFISLPVPEVVEIVGLVGFDYIVIDEEHGCLDRESIRNLIIAARSVDIEPIVRVRENNFSQILQVIDLGAVGVIVPHIENKQDALNVVKAVKYFPEGERSMSQRTRSTNYFVQDIKEYIKNANEDSIIFLLIESKEAAANLDGIIEVHGIDGVLIGHQDLAQSLGFPGERENPIVMEAIKNIIRKVTEKGLTVMTAIRRIEEAVDLVKMGVRCVIIDKDISMLYKIYQSEFNLAKKILK